MGQIVIIHFITIYKLELIKKKLVEFERKGAPGYSDPMPSSGICAHSRQI